MRISYTALENYQTCPLKYKFSDIDKIKAIKNKEAVFGSLIHSVMKFIHTPSIKTPTLEEALDFYARHWKSQPFSDEIEERTAFSQGVSMIKNYYQKNDIVSFNIVDLESHFNIEIGQPPNSHTVKGIIDRIDKTEEGYEIIDYKTSKKMPSQEEVDNNLQLSVYLEAFLRRYPQERQRLETIKVSLYFLKHGVKLSSVRAPEQLKEAQNTFLEIVREIEKGNFEARLNPLCDWCGYQNICPLWKHKFKSKQAHDSAEIEKFIDEYILAKKQAAELKSKLEKIQELLAEYMDQEGIDQIFGQQGSLLRKTRKVYKYDEKQLRSLLEPLGKWESVLKVDGSALQNIVDTLPYPVRREIEKTKILEKESKIFTVRKEKIQ